jgi:uncharacterized lipoprotein YmbA
VLAAGALTACAAPQLHYYRIAVIPGASRNPPPVSIGVRGISLPNYLAQAGIPKAGGDYQFDVYANDLWAGRLGDMLQGVMVQDLAQRLPGATIVGTGGSISETSDLLIEINILRFDPDSSGQVLLSAQVAIKSGPSRALRTTRSYELRSDPLGATTSDSAAALQIVAKMSALWAALADRVADLTVANAGT